MLEAATVGGAAAFGLQKRLGRIAPGQLADLVLVRCDAAGTLALQSDIAALVQHAGPEHVDSVMVDGRWAMRDRRILAFDEPRVLHEAAEQAALLRARIAGKLPTLRTAMPPLVSHFVCR